MENVFLTSLTLPEVQQLFRKELEAFYAKVNTQPAPQKEENDFTNIDGAMEITGLERSTIYNKWSKGEMPGYKKSRRLYFKRSELIAWLESGKRKTIKEIAEKV